MPAEAHAEQETAHIAGLGYGHRPHREKYAGVGAPAGVLRQTHDLDQKMQQVGDVKKPEERGHETAEPPGLKIAVDDGERKEEETEQKEVVARIPAVDVVGAHHNGDAADQPERADRTQPHFLEQAVEFELGERGGGGHEGDARVHAKENKGQHKDHPEERETEDAGLHACRAGGGAGSGILQLFGGLPVAAFARGVVAQCVDEIRFPEIRPKHLADVDFRVGGL